MTIYDLMMQDEKIKKSVLIEFGFSELQPRKVEEWFKKENPDTYAQFKQQCKNDNVIGFNPKSVEASTRAERDAILDNFMNQTKKTRKVVQVYEDELEQLIELKNEYRYQSEKWEHILHGFIGQSKLENAFFDWIDKQQQYIDSGQDDEFGVTNELYGDLDELREHFSYLLEEPTLIAKTMQEAKSKANNELLFQLLEQFRLYKIAKTDEQKQQAYDKFHGNYTELYQRFNNKK
ncbi:hypothetical protein [Schinkia azotoformans]|uniref:hypothetical protein n=1 Tax=Schinkia azotoformans TaxID=1454 RepID=UPI002DBDEF82|nr:hypothetical protein [Schinkia azotoformans]MEC1697736.1 hypothetical protein [Schinkia azotoformans]